MANDQDGGNFPDLLSAALSESGLGDDLEDLLTSPTPNTGISQPAFPSASQTNTQYLLSNQTGTPTRPQQLVRVATPGSAQTPTGVRHVQIVRTTTPLSVAGGAGGIRRVLVRSATPGSTVRPTTAGAAATSSPVQRLIVRGNQPVASVVTGNPQKLVRTPSGAIKVVKLMPRAVQGQGLAQTSAVAAPRPVVSGASPNIRTIRVAPGTISRLTGSPGTTTASPGTHVIKLKPGSNVPTLQTQNQSATPVKAALPSAPVGTTITNRLPQPGNSIPASSFSSVPSAISKAGVVGSTVAPAPSVSQPLMVPPVATQSVIPSANTLSTSASFNSTNSGIQGKSGATTNGSSQMNPATSTTTSVSVSSAAQSTNLGEVAPVAAKEEASAPPAEEDDELDFFGALQELQETNKKAEEQQKQKKPDPLPSTSSILTSASSLGRLNPTSSLTQLPASLSTINTSVQGTRVGSPLTLQGGTIVRTNSGQRIGSPVTIQGTSILQHRVNSPITVIKTNPASSSQSTSSLAGASPGQFSMKVLPGGIVQTIHQPQRTNTPPLGGQRFYATTSAANQATSSKPVYPSGTKITIGGPGEGIRVMTPGGTASRMLAAAQGVPPNGSVQTGVHNPQLTDKDVTRLWANEDISLKKLQQQVSMIAPGGPAIPGLPLRPVQGVEELEVEEEEEELGHAETYNDYMPPKLKIGIRHPDMVVETSSLASVEPPDVWYKLAIPEGVIDNGFLSALQLESITYACQKQDTLLPSGHRAGYLIGDGAGVGKGRTVAGIIYENYLQGRKRALWLSVSNDLRVDAERDLRDIGASKIEVHPLNKFKYAKISSHINGSVKKGVIFATYSSLIGESQASGKYRTRFKQLIHWLGKDFDGPIVFDECHKAKNLCPVGSSKPTKTGLTVLQLQNKLPKARIIYASATGASEPKNMAYMTRLGLWGPGTPFKEFNDFIQAVEKRGVGAMELVAMDMKLRGMYIARQLSFQGVSFKIEEVPISREYVGLYNSAVKLWVDAREKFQVASELMDCDQRTKKTMWGQFWSSHQRFFKYLCISAKVPYCVKIARQAIKEGKCVVIGLQSTGEARTLEALEEQGELNDFVSTAKGVIQSLVDRHFPAPNTKKTFGFLGLSGIFDDSPSSSPKAGQKRKRKKIANSNAKRKKEDWTDEEDSDPSDDEKEPSRPATPSEPSSESDSDDDDDEDDDSDENDFNPFANGSDSDEDVWARKNKKKSKKQKAKEEKKRKKEEEKRKKKEEKKKKKKDKKRKDDDSDDEFDDIDSQFDKALEAVGLKSGKENSMGPVNSARQSLREGTDAVEQAIQMKMDLLAHIDKIGDQLPPNTLDELIDSLGGTDNVAEMTGRKGRVVSTDDGTIQYESRSESDIPLEVMNLAEKQRFMDGEKNVAVISEAASSGISLQADRRAVNQKRRVHITLELPWSADRAIQQFGRTHRSNQVSAPEYVFLISELAGEQRFASTVAKRLESLGALTHGDRRATESRDLSRFNIDNKYGRTALEAVMKSVLELEAPIVSPPAGYQGDFFKDVRHGLIGVGMINWDDRFGVASLEKDYNNISKFLNRILGVEVTVQNSLFSYFNETLAAVIMQAKRNGRWDMGILDLGKQGEAVKKLETKTFVGTFSGSSTRIELHTLSVERGTSWDQAMDIWHDHAAPDDGFYVGAPNRNGKRGIFLAAMITGKRKDRLYNIYKPNSGLQARPETLDDIKSKGKKVLPDEARQFWEDQYFHSAQMCSHMFWRGSCKRLNVHMSCEVGLRSRTYYVLSGSVLSVWTKVEQVLASVPGGFATRMQIIRMRTDDGSKIVGTLIPANALKTLISVLSADSQRSFNTQHNMSAQEQAFAADSLFGSPKKKPKLESFSLGGMGSLGMGGLGSSNLTSGNLGIRSLGSGSLDSGTLGSGTLGTGSLATGLSTPGQLHRTPGQLHRTPGQLHRIASAPSHLSHTPQLSTSSSLSLLPSQQVTTPVAVQKPIVVSKPPSPVKPPSPSEYLSMPSFL